MTVTRAPLVIERLGSDGDGLARDGEGRLIVVPFALPGETIVEGTISSLSADRTVSACPHFTVCGGCVAQHMGDALYRQWKRDLLVTAFAAHKLEPGVEPLVVSPPHSRRRATFSLVRRDGSWTPGFHKRRDTAVVALTACTVVTPRIERALPRLADLLDAWPGVTDATRVYVAELDGGLDVVVEGASVKLSADQRVRLATLAGAAGFARLTADREAIIEHAAVSLPNTGGSVRPEPGAFFQAVSVAERAIVEAVTAGLGRKTKRIADLFAGIGTLTLPLAKHAPVTAFDSDKPALATLDAAARRTQGIKAVATRYRDLIGEPLSVKELEPFDVVVLDPPRAGAKAQAERLAQSGVKVVMMVSCSPQSLARDTRTLVDGGFSIDRVTPIDQFLWSAHLEVVAVLRR